MDNKKGLIHCDVDQRSEEWLIARRGIATASNFSKVITSQGKRSTQISNYAFELAADRFMDEIEENFQSHAMKRGEELEPVAKTFYEIHSGNDVTECGFYKTTLDDGSEIGCSPDGLIGEDGLIEIKCPLKSQHMKNLTSDKLPTEYIAQVQGQLFIMDRKWCDFVSFNPSFKEGFQLKVFRVEKDLCFIDFLKEHLLYLYLIKIKILNKINDN
jgi:putative phage-type endonuclease